MGGLALPSISSTVLVKLTDSTYHTGGLETLITDKFSGREEARKIRSIAID